MYVSFSFNGIKKNCHNLKKELSKQRELCLQLCLWSASSLQQACRHGPEARILLANAPTGTIKSPFGHQ